MPDPNFRVGSQWAGGGKHTGHLITAIELWPVKEEPTPEGRVHISNGRCRCSCGVEWDFGGYPIEFTNPTPT